jgi:hypothetical protein
MKLMRFLRSSVTFFLCLNILFIIVLSDTLYPLSSHKVEVSNSFKPTGKITVDFPGF